MFLQMAQNGPIPPALARKPELDFRLLFIYESFIEIQGLRRYIEGGPLPLTFADVMTHAEFYEHSKADARWLWEYIKLIDFDWMRQYQEKRKKDAAKPTNVTTMPR